jgi:hypothetical protein
VSTDKDEATGNPSLDGWLYQCEVSVWAALDLLLVKRLAAEVQLEPASQEDIEAELDAPRAASEIATSSTLLVVQAKLRRTGQWTRASLRSMIEHGKERDSAIKRLENTNVRYVLVTSADVNPELQPLLVEDFVEQPEAERLPAEIFGDALAKEAAGRFAILGLHTEQRLGERIERILMSPLSVPQPQLERCRKRLRDAALAGMSQGVLWRREALEEIIRDCGGAIPSDVTDAYVEPSCWKGIVHQMETRHAVVLVGPSGTGKTTTASAIEEYLRQRFAGLDVVRVERAADIRSCHNDGPTLFYLDDPWGKYEITKERHAWDVDLPNFLHEASARRMYVVTTRLDIFNEAVRDSDAFARWELRLDAGSYGPSQRAQLYKNRLEQLHGGALKTAALEARSRVLKSLDTPFEIDRFFHHLKPGPASGDKDEAAFIERVLRSTQHDAIEVEVRQLVTQRSSEHWAAVLWGLMAARRGVGREELPTIRRRLGKLDSVFKSGLEALVDALVAGGSLRQPSSKLSYAHPRVELGLMSAMKAQPEIAEDALGALLTVLVALDGSDAGRGAETAARVYEQMLRETGWRLIDAEAQTGIDSWIAHAFGSPEADFPALMGLAASTGSANSLPAEVARWLAPERRNWRRMLDAWKEPVRPEQWYERVRAHPLTRHICIGFITKVLPVESGIYPDTVADALDRLASELGDAWLHSALDIVEAGYVPNGSVIAYGAVRYEDHRDVLLEAAVKVLRSLQSQTYDAAEALAVEDGHFDEDDFMDHEESGASAEQLCLAYVTRLRAEGGWRRLARSVYVAELLGYWAKAVRATKPARISREERVALFDHAEALREEVTAWEVARHCWIPEFEPRLRSRLEEGHPDAVTRRAAVQCALVAAPKALQDEVAFCLRQSTKKSLCELLFEVSHARLYGVFKEMKSPYEQFAARVPEHCRELVDLFGVEAVSGDALSDEALAVAAQGALECTGRVQAILLQAISSRCAISAELASHVIRAPEPETAMAGLRAAEAAGMWDLIETAIGHQRADVRRLAFDIMVGRNGGVVAPRWLGLASDKSSRVRKALVAALGEKPPEGAQAALVLLCADEWVSQSHSYPHEEFPIARAAATALAHVSGIDEADAARLLERARLTSDPELQSRIYVALACNAGDEARSTLADIAFERGPRQRRVSAMRALAIAGTTVADYIFEPLTAAWLSAAAPELAMWGAAALGSCAALSRIDDVCDKLAVSSTRRVLLIAVVLGLRERDPGLAQRALEYLPRAHPARRLLDGAGLLPSEVLDDLGDIEVVNAVLTLCDNLVEERPRRPILRDRPLSQG